MSTNHTPGPWRYVRTNPNPTHGEHMISGAKPGFLAEIRDCGSGDVQANAALVAGAPCLLAALRRAAAALESVSYSDPSIASALAAARAAIARAEGRS